MIQGTHPIVKMLLLSHVHTSGSTELMDETVSDVLWPADECGQRVSGQEMTKKQKPKHPDPALGPG